MQTTKPTKQPTRPNISIVVLRLGSLYRMCSSANPFCRASSPRTNGHVSIEYVCVWLRCDMPHSHYELSFVHPFIRWFDGSFVRSYEFVSALQPFCKMLSMCNSIYNLDWIPLAIQSLEKLEPLCKQTAKTTHSLTHTQQQQQPDKHKVRNYNSYRAIV